ncbi:hypothetical protein BDV18DRAFT_23641 [Aspergillus unguis]
MKLTTAILCGLYATTASAAFDKFLGWGKRDYPCINAYSGPTDNSTLSAGSTVEIQWDLNSGRCGNTYDGASTGNYSLWLYYNPVHDLGFANWDHQITIDNAIPPGSNSVTFSIPTDLPADTDEMLWYLRLSTYLPDAPQIPSLFNILGPIRIVE